MPRVRRHFGAEKYGFDSSDLTGDQPCCIHFKCVDCGQLFTIPTEHYDGRWDHPPGEPRCGDCEEDE